MATRPVPPRPAYSAPHASHLSDYLRVLSKRRWTAALGLLVVFVAGAFRTLKSTPIYEATTQILIEEGARPTGTLTSVMESQQDSFYEDEFYLTQYRILQSRALALRAIDALGPSHASESMSPAGRASWWQASVRWVATKLGAARPIAPPPADETTVQSEQIDDFLEGLSVEPIRNTRLVEVQYRSPDPLLASRAANAVATQYREQSKQTRFLASKETNSWLDQQLEAQRQIVEASDLKVQQFKEAYGVVAVDDRQNVLVQRLGDLNAELTRARTERITRQALYTQLQALQANQGDVDAYPVLATNEFIQKLKVELNDQQQERARMTAKYLEKSPEVQAQDQRIDLTKNKLAMEIGQAIEGIHTDFLASKAKEESLQDALSSQRQEALGMGRRGIEFAALQREAAGNRQLYENLLQMAKETGVTTQYKGSNISIVDAAEIPREPVLPRTGRDLTMSLLGGCLLALALVFGFEYMDSRIKTPDEIKQYLGLAFLGMVPSVPSTKSRDGLLLGDPLPPPFSEAIRALRTAVIFSSADEGARTIVVTSTAPSEGKTSIASNLACALAQSDQRTLLIDADLRRPRLHEIFGRPQEPGLSNVLVGTARLRDAVRVTSTPNLYVMPAGHLPPNPAELLGSNRYIELIDELQNQYQWIIIDAPPVMAVTDATIVAHTSTGVLFVVGSEMTPRRHAMAAVEQLAGARSKFIGAVLNRVNIERHPYYYSPYYRKDYSRAYERSR